MKVLNKTLIKSVEENAVNSGIFSYTQLMKNAGNEATQIINNTYNLKGKRIAVICGNGNNGGDGFVIAQNLKNSGFNVSVITPLGEPLTETAKHYYNQLSNIEISNELNGDYDVLIDALFGIGLNRPLGSEIITLIEKINCCNAVRIAIDIPSGIACDTGEILGKCINADLTITFIALKPCFMLPFATDYCGNVIVLGFKTEVGDDASAVISACGVMGVRACGNGQIVPFCEDLRSFVELGESVGSVDYLDAVDVSGDKGKAVDILFLTEGVGVDNHSP